MQLINELNFFHWKKQLAIIKDRLSVRMPTIYGQDLQQLRPEENIVCRSEHQRDRERPRKH